MAHGQALALLLGAAAQLGVAAVREFGEDAPGLGAPVCT